jgi:hypothetical protein
MSAVNTAPTTTRYDNDSGAGAYVPGGGPYAQVYSDMSPQSGPKWELPADSDPVEMSVSDSDWARHARSHAGASELGP